MLVILKSFPLLEAHRSRILVQEISPPLINLKSVKVSAKRRVLRNNSFISVNLRRFERINVLLILVFISKVRLKPDFREV